jgi:hypothetical protein
MEQDDLKSAWQNMNAGQKTNAELSSMMRERTHPVLKRIRKQLILESISFALFLFVYYDFFDGDRKPVYANVLLVSAMLFAIIHNIAGYMLTKRSVKGDTIKQSLEGQLLKMKGYAMVSVAGRVLIAGCLLFFFVSVITFNTNKYWILVGLIVVIIIQIVLLSAIWVKRIRQMKTTIDLFQ